jgi:hypothetical protein
MNDETLPSGAGRTSAPPSAWCMDQEWVCNNPNPRLGSNDADIVRASRRRHAVEVRDGTIHRARVTNDTVRINAILVNGGRGQRAGRPSASRDQVLEGTQVVP